MITFFKKNSFAILILFFILSLFSMQSYPLITLIFALTFLLFSLVITTYSITEKHKKRYLKGQITKMIFLRNVILEVTVILLTMLLAALLGNHIAKVATGQITNILARFIIGIIIGLLVGIGVGIFIKRLWEKIQQFFIKWNNSKNTI